MIYNIFYSWQSDLPNMTNNNAIRLAIKESGLNCEKINSELRILFEEATRNVPGSPHIPSTILSKIQNADIFIADITTINMSDTVNRKVANPNVLIELGFAISVVVWERIILVFNGYFGTFPDDLPFDIDRQRILDYKIKDGKGQLPKELSDSISLIIKSNLKKPNERNKKTVQEKQRDNDINTISEFFKSIHLLTIDEFISELPDHIPNRIFFFWEEFNAKTDNSYFYLFDNEIKNLYMISSLYGLLH